MPWQLIAFTNNIIFRSSYKVGDVHLYNNHFEQAELQLKRIPFELPQMKINRSVTNISDFKFEDFELINYQSHPAIKALVAI